MIKKKICMVGDFAVGKTSLTQKFVNNVFSEKYLTTVGVKIDVIEVNAITLVIWDIAGRDSLTPINSNYLVGASGIVYVVDGTRSKTLDALDTINKIVEEKLGKPPCVIAVNKDDDQSKWDITEDDMTMLKKKGVPVLRTSAKNGFNVKQVFEELAKEIAKGSDANYYLSGTKSIGC